MNPVIYVFLNKKLNMSIGKAAAQASHATALSVINSPQELKNKWEDANHRTIIILEARDEQHMSNIKEYLDERGYRLLSVIDEGANEVEPQTLTALSTQILDKESSMVQDVFRQFKLFRDSVRVVLEVEK